MDSEKNETEELRVAEDPNLVTEEMVNRVGASDSTDTSEAHELVQLERQEAAAEHERSEKEYLAQVEAAEKTAQDRPEGEFTGSHEDTTPQDDEK